MFQYFSFFFWRKKIENETEEETKTDNEKWKLIEEEPEIRKTNYVNFFEADKRKNNKKGFKIPSYKNKQRQHHPEKNLQKKGNWQKKAFVRQESKEETFPCFWKKVKDSEKTQKENKREKKDERHVQKTQKTQKKEK